MSVEIRGIENLQKAIANAYSGAQAKQIRKQALNAGGDVVARQMKKNFEAFQGAGYSKEEIMRTDARTKNDVEELKIGWNGPHERWRIIHLNEFGYTRNGKQYTPRGFGVIKKTIDETKKEYFDTVANEMRKRL